MPVESSRWREVIAFRDYLRAHAEVAADYEALKRRLAHVHHLDREAYTEAKRSFIERMTDIALKNGYGLSRHA